MSRKLGETRGAKLLTEEQQCRAWLERSQDYCGRAAGHRHQHRGLASMEQQRNRPRIYRRKRRVSTED